MHNCIHKHIYSPHLLQIDEELYQNHSVLSNVQCSQIIFPLWRSHLDYPTKISYSNYPKVNRIFG